MVSSYGVHSKVRNFWIVVLAIIAVDQITKFFSKGIEDAITVIPNFLWFNYVENTGAAFGIFQGNKFLLGLLSMTVAAVIAYYIVNHREVMDKWVGLSFIAGGALGNAIDRIFYTGVIDFIDFGFFPVFNIADTFVTLGVTIYIIQELFFSKEEKKEEKISW